MWSGISPGMFLWGVIYLKHAGTTIRALHPGFFVWIWPRPYQFVRCEGRAGARPSAAAVTDGDVLHDFLTLEKFRVNTRGTEEDILLVWNLRFASHRTIVSSRASDKSVWLAADTYRSFLSVPRRVTHASKTQKQAFTSTHSRQTWCCSQVRVRTKPVLMQSFLGILSCPFSV